MIGPSGAVRVMMATRPVDFRKGMDGLAALVRDAVGADPFSGTVYVFRSKRADRAKLLFWDGSGVVLATKRLEAGQLCWPKIEDGVVRLTAAQLAALLEGLDWKRVHAGSHGHRPSAGRVSKKVERAGPITDQPPRDDPGVKLVHGGPLRHGQLVRRSWSGERSWPSGERWHEHLRGRRSVSQRGMWAHSVVVTSPAFDDDLRFSECVEDLTIQEFVAQTRVEALNVPILPG